MWTELKKSKIVSCLPTKCIAPQLHISTSKAYISSSLIHKPPTQIVPVESVLAKSTKNASIYEEERKTPNKTKKFSLQEDLYPVKLYNRMEGNLELSNKKSLFSNLKSYYDMIGEDPFNTLPLTFMVKEGLNDPAFSEFGEYFTRNIGCTWIIKPGENSNRGQGIKVEKDLKEIKLIVDRSSRFTRRSTII